VRGGAFAPQVRGSLRSPGCEASLRSAGACARFAREVEPSAFVRGRAHQASAASPRTARGKAERPHQRRKAPPAPAIAPTDVGSDPTDFFHDRTDRLPVRLKPDATYRDRTARPHLDILHMHM